MDDRPVNCCAGPAGKLPTAAPQPAPPWRNTNTVGGRASLSVRHQYIEFTAINLASTTAARFRGLPLRQ